MTHQYFWLYQKRWICCLGGACPSTASLFVFGPAACGQEGQWTGSASRPGLGTTLPSSWSSSYRTAIHLEWPTLLYVCIVCLYRCLGSPPPGCPAGVATWKDQVHHVWEQCAHHDRPHSTDRVWQQTAHVNREVAEQRVCWQSLHAHIWLTTGICDSHHAAVTE